MEILVKGHNTIKLTSHGEEYTIQRPSSFVYVSLFSLLLLGVVLILLRR